jgi:hypothetical protein
MTEIMAISKFGEKLKPEDNGPYGPYRKTFYVLRKEHKSFKHKPTKRSKNHEYFWVADLKKAAQAKGWNPNAPPTPQKTNFKRNAPGGPGPGANKQHRGSY